MQTQQLTNESRDTDVLGALTLHPAAFSEKDEQAPKQMGAGIVQLNTSWVRIGPNKVTFGCAGSSLTLE